MLPGIVGTIQACEAIKVLLGLGEPLSGRLLTFDTLSMDFRPLRIYRDPECPVCADARQDPADRESAGAAVTSA